MILFYFNCFVRTCELRIYFPAKARVFYYEGRKERLNSGSKEIIYVLFKFKEESNDKIGGFGVVWNLDILLRNRRYM
jgi:hypothetical protein